MTIPVPLSATGGLFASGGRIVELDVWRAVRGIQLSPVEGTSWAAMELVSREPLLGEIDSTEDGFRYYYLFRRGLADRFLLVSSDSQLNAILLHKAGIADEVLQPKIDVGGLVNELSRKPGAYAMSAVYASIEGYGQALRRSSFFGTDLAEALLFTQLLPHLLPYRVTLRDIARRTDVLSASSKGEIAFTYSGPTSLRDTDAALRFISARGHMAWTVDDDTALHTAPLPR